MNTRKEHVHMISEKQMEEIAEYIVDDRPVSLKNSDGMSDAAH